MMNQLTADQFSVQMFGHLGLIAATIDMLGIVDKIDAIIPCGESAKTTMGQRVKAMILNGLGFLDDRLYMFPKFLSDKPISRLFGQDIDPGLFNDDALGRCLDAIAGYGVTKCFSTLAMDIGVEQNLLGKASHIDTTTLSLYGDYPEDGTEQKDEETGADKKIAIENAAIGEQAEMKEDVQKYESETNPLPRYGFAKNNRQDLKQMVLNLATTGKAGFPIWFEANSGNASDKKILLEAGKKLNQLCKSLKAAPEFLVVGDSAIYEACLKEGGTTLWLTRVPETHRITKDMVQKPDSEFTWSDLGSGYRASYNEIKYKDIKQRWAVIFSQAAYDREIVTLNRNIKADLKKTEAALWHLGNQVFTCEKDALRELKRFRKKLRYHEVVATCEAATKHTTCGRPKENAALKVIGYKINGSVVENKTRIEQACRSKGRFILATNQLNKDALPDANILTEYKEQSKTESGFKFIKDSTFEVDSVFLKKPSRIQALMMIMVLCLMVYAFAQHHMRKKLEEKQETIPNQVDKPTNKPTAIWVFKTLRSISIVRVRIEDAAKEFVANLNEICVKIIKLFGPEAMRIYEVT